MVGLVLTKNLGLVNSQIYLDFKVDKIYINLVKWCEYSVQIMFKGKSNGIYRLIWLYGKK